MKTTMTLGSSSLRDETKIRSVENSNVECKEEKFQVIGFRNVVDREFVEV